MLFFLFFSTSVLAEEMLIANSNISVSTLSSEQISEIYLLKILSWPDGQRIIPVNRESSSDVRSHFNSTVLKQDNAELSTYWNQMHFKGRIPPVTQESDQAVAAFVQKVPGAIGYVSATTAIGTAKVIGRVP